MTYSDKRMLLDIDVMREKANEPIHKFQPRYTLEDIKKMREDNQREEGEIEEMKKKWEKLK